VAVAVTTVLLVAALFAGDSVWTALGALLAAGGWSVLALAGRAHQPAGAVATSSETHAASRKTARTAFRDGWWRVTGVVKVLVSRGGVPARAGNLAESLGRH